MVAPGPLTVSVSFSSAASPRTRTYFGRVPVGGGSAAVSGLQSVVRDEVTGFLLESHEPELYADRLRRLLEEPELSEQMGRRGTLLAQRFTWNRTADHLVDVYEEVAEPVQAGGVHLGFRHE